ncbi:hypothetical protein KAR91_64665, partial [Candidatus Pacearchaeota archaeon]|nr:hypothetical protein [Candidatus Pacearchaeota archaeon]
MSKIGYIFALVVGLAMGLPDIVLAAEGAHGDMLNLTTHGWGYTSLIIFGVTSTMIQIKKGLDLPISGEPQQTVVETK